MSPPSGLGRKRTLQTLGLAFIIIGLILVVNGLIPLVYNCPANGCGPEISSAIYLKAISFFTGVAFIIAGIVLLFVARRMET